MLKLNKKIEDIYFDDLGDAPLSNDPDGGYDFHRPTASVYGSFCGPAVRLYTGYDGLDLYNKKHVKELITWLQDVYDNCEDV